MKQKRLLLPLLLLVALLALAACGEGTPGTVPGTTDGGTTALGTGGPDTPGQTTPANTTPARTTPGQTTPPATTVPGTVPGQGTTNPSDPPFDPDDLNDPACSHRYTAVMVPPTATRQGYTLYTCSSCGHRYQADVRAALGCPVLRITTDGGAGVTSKETYVSCSVTLENTEARYAFASLKAGIRLRGNSTAGGAKKPYRIKFEQKQQLLGLGDGAAKSWLLMAEYYDYTLMRNYMTHALGRVLSGIPFASDGTFVEVYLNGRYAGVYYLCEQVQVQKNRIGIDESGEKDPAVTDTGYLLELEQFASRRAEEGTEGVDFFRVPGTPYYYVIKSETKSPAQVAYIQTFMGELYAAIASGDEAAVRARLDVDSAVDMYLLQLLASDPDSTCTSMYVWKDKGGKLVVGAPWDFDIAWGNYNKREQTNTEEWMFPLLQALYQQKWFYRLVCDRWTELRADGLVEDLFNTVTAAMRDYKAAFDRNYARWPVWGTLTNGLTTENAKAFRSQADAVRYLFRWIAGRVAWIDGRLGYVGQEDFSAWFRE